MNDKLLISITDAAQALSVCRNTVYALIRSGNLRVVQIGRRRMIAAASVRALVEGGVVA